MKLLLVITIFIVSLLAGSVPQMCPEGMVPTGVGTSCIDRYEWPNQAGAKPLVGVTGLPIGPDKVRGVTMDATTLCASVGKRVCKRDEWIAACRYKSGIWPDGRHLARVYEPGELVCNNDQRYIGPIDEAALGRRDPAEFERLDQSEPSGSRQRCESISGARDMVGNAEEWVRCPGVGKYGWCLMGRYWSEPRSCTHTVALHSPLFFYYETGFRCCTGG